MKVTVFSTLAFERPFLEQANGARHELHFLEARLGANTAPLAQGSEAVCVFTPDNVLAPMLEKLRAHGVRRVAVRGAGYDNVDLPAGEHPLGDRVNMGYKGTFVTNGRATAYVVATGMGTELGKIATLIQADETVTPLQKRLATLGKYLSVAALVIGALFFGAGGLRGEPLGSLLLVSISLAIAALPVPLLAIHILWVNLITDGLPGLALAYEPSEANNMQRPPINPRQTIFANGLGWFIVLIGVLVGGLTIGTEAWALCTGLAHWQTMAFTVLCFSQLGLALAIRSRQESIFTIGLRSNKPLLGAVVLTVALHLLIIYVPFFNDLFSTKPLTWKELGLTVAVSSGPFWAVELQKLIMRRRAQQAVFGPVCPENRF